MKTLERWSQATEEYGISEFDLKAMSLREGITDENGKLTKRALDDGILIFINQGQTRITAENKLKAIILAEFEILKKKCYEEREHSILIKVEGIKNLTSSVGEVNVVLNETVIF